MFASVLLIHVNLEFLLRLHMIFICEYKIQEKGELMLHPMWPAQGFESNVQKIPVIN